MNKNLILVLILIIPICFSCNRNTKKMDNNTAIQKEIWEISKKGIKETFGLDILERIGTLDLNEDKKIYIIKGTINSDYFQETNIYLYPSDTNYYFGSLKKKRFSMPGKTMDINEKIIYNARLFYGKYRNDNYSSILWYQNELMEDGSHKLSVFEVLFNENNVQFKSIEDLKEIEELIKNIELKGLEELKGETTYVEP